jgi:prepilin-type N-terminal cleavage/methylation domain-containing protein
MKREHGFTLVEVLVASTILLAGVLTAMTAMNASRKLTLVSERRGTINQRAQAELERLKAIPFSQLGLTGMASSWSTNPSDYTYVGSPTGSCPSNAGGSAPTYQPDHSVGGSSATEPLVIDGCTYTLSGTATAISAGTVAPVTAWTDGNAGGMSGNVYDFITWTADPTCSQTSTPGSVCPTTNDYKRLTVVVTLNGATEPSHPAIVSAYVADPNTNSNQNPFKSPSTQCTDSSGATVPCFLPVSGTPVQLPLCDSSYSGGSCSTPPCAGNALHNTLVSVLGVAAAPDLLGSALPTGACTTGTPPAPLVPCYATDKGTCGQQGGLPLPPVGTTCGSSPPLDNTKSHSWVTSPMYTGASMNLSGNGSLTAYLMSNSGVAANVTVCLGLYVIPGGVLGNLLGNLLSHPIGAVVTANVTAQAGFPTPVSFDFNVGQALNVTGSLLGTRVELVLWLAASAGTNVSLAYDQAQVASQLTLMTS